MSADLSGRTVLLGVTGSIAAYKAAAVASALACRGAAVVTLMTRSAQEFITPLTFETLTRHPVVTDLFGPRAPDIEESRHISLAEQADVLLIAPATANVIAKMANGITDDLLTCTAMATRAPILVAPAMNHTMYTHPATRRNVALLTDRGCRFIGPEEGRLANGRVGLGRLAEPEAIVAAVCEVLQNRPSRSEPGGAVTA